MDRSNEYFDIVEKIRKGSSLPSSLPEMNYSRFHKEADSLLTNVIDMHAFLDSNFHLYISFESNMNDVERDEIHKEATSFLFMCKNKIEDIKKIVSKETKIVYDDEGGLSNTSKAAHQYSIITYLWERMQSITNLVKNQQNIRLKQTQQNNSRLGNSTAAMEALNLYKRKAGMMNNIKNKHSNDDEGEEDEEEEEEEEWKNISSKEKVQLLLENKDLQRSLENELDEVQKIEEQLTEITSLFDTFNSKIVEQHEQISHILDGVIESRDHIEKGNAQLEEGLTRTYSGQKYMAIFLMVASFSLLFLDWYS